MAKYGRTLAEVKVFIDGKEQAKKVLEELTAEADRYKKAIADSNKKLTEIAEQVKTDPKKVVDYENERKNLLKLEREYKKLKRSISETEKLAADIEKDLDNMSGLSVSRLRTLERQLKAVQSNLTPKKDPNGTFIAFLNESIKKVSDAIKSRRGEFVEFESIMAKISHVDDRSLDNVIKRLKDLIATTDKLDGDKMIKYTEQLAFAEETKRQRTLQSGERLINRVKSGSYTNTVEGTQADIKALEEYSKALKTSDVEKFKELNEVVKQLSANLDEYNKKKSTETLTTNLQTSGTADIKQAVDWLTKYQGTLEPLSQEWKEVNAQIEAGNARLKHLTDATKYEAMAKQFSDLNYLSTNALAEQKKYWESMRDNAEAGTESYNEAISKLKEINELETNRMKQQSRETLTTGLQTAGTADIKQAVDWLTKYQGTLEPLSQEWREVNAQIEAGNERLKQLTNQTKLETMTAQFAKLGDLSANAFAEQKKYWEGIRDSVAESDPLYKQAIDNLKQITDLESTRMKSSARETLTTNLQTSGTADIKQAVDWLTKYQGTLEPLSQEWKEVNTQIEAGNERLKQLGDRIKNDAMSDQFKNLSNLSKNALEEQQKYWQSVLDNASKGTAAYIQAERKLQAIGQEMNDRLDTEKGKILNNLSSYSVSEIEDAIKATEKLRDAQKAGSAEYGIYNNEIKRAKEYLQSYVDLNKQIDMEGKWSNLTTLSANALAEQKKYWQEMVNGAQNGSQELQDYQNRLKAVTDEESRRAENKYLNVANNPDRYSTSEIEEAVKVFQKLRDEQQMGSQQWQWYADLVNKATDQLSRFKDEAKMKVMTDQFADLKDLSVNALAEQKKYWKEVFDSAQAGTAAYNDAFDKLKDIRDLEESRTKRNADMDIQAALSGNWNRTIEDTEKAIKLIEEYKKQLHVKTDAAAIDEANQAITILNQNLGKAKEALMDVNEALDIGKQLEKGTFDGTTEEILRAKKALEEYRKTLKQKTDAKRINEVDEALRNVTNSAEQAKGKLVDVNVVLDKLDTASMEELQAAAKQLQDQLNGATRKTSEYAENAAKLRQVHLELKRVKKEWEGQENVIARTAKRLASYILVYAGWNEIWGQLKQVYQANLQLSDSLADIQKTTGLSAESVAHLSDQINAIDTRTAQEQLHELAYEAGKLGISAEEDVLAFAKAGNQLLVALGEDLGGAEAVRQLMKVNAILGETQELGVEKALLSTGSAINEISQTSRASAGPIADMVSRMGAIGSAAGLSMSDLIALAGTADSLGQSAEVAATAFNKFIATLTSNPVDVAYALGMDPDQIQRQLNAGNTIQVIQDIFAKMSQMGNMADLAPIMGELGSEGARMTQVLVTMAKGVDELNAQVFTSRRAFEEATSVTNEYNIKNESAAAIVQRMGNNIKEMFTNSTLVEWLREVLQWLYYIPNALERNREMLLLVRAILWEIASVTLVKLVAMLKTSLVGALGSATLAWKSFYVQAAAAFFGIERSNPHWRRMTLHCIATTGAVGKLRVAFLALGRVLKANPIFFIGSIIAGVVTAIQQLTDETEKAVRVNTEYLESVEKESRELGNLRYAINNANSANGERASLIQQLNSKYGQYLGFMVTEENYLRNQEYIYRLLNAQIQRSIALKMQEKMVSDIASKYVDQQREAYEDMTYALNGATNIGETGAAEETSKLMAAIKEQAQDGVDDINEVLAKIGGETFQKVLAYRKEQLAKGIITQEDFDKYVGQLRFDTFGAQATNLANAVKDMLGIEINIANEAKKASDLSKASIDALTKNVEEIKKEEIEEILPKISTTESVKELQEYQQKLNSFIQEQKNSVKGLTQERADLNSLTFNEETQLKEINEKLAKKQELTEEEQKQYDLLIKKQNKELTLSKEKEEQWKAVNDQVEIYNNALKEVDKKLFNLSGQSLWGPNENLEDKAPEELAAMYAKLEKDAARLSKTSFKNIGEIIEKDGKDYATQFWKNFDTRDQAIEWYKNQKNALAAQLDKLGYTVRGKFKTGGDGSGDSEQRAEARRNYQAAMSALEAYYKEYEDFIRQKREQQLITEEDMNRQLLDNTRKYNEDKQQLIKKFLGEESTFDQTQYVGILTKYDYFKDKDLDEMAKQYQEWGDAMTDGGRNQMAKAGVEIRKAINKEQESIKAELLKGDMFGSFENNFAGMLDELGVLTSNLEDTTIQKMNEVARAAGKEELWGLSPEERSRRIADLVEFADESYQIDAHGLRARMMENEKFSEWVKNMNMDEMTVLLDKLRWYYDQRLLLTKRYQEQMKKEFEAYYEQTGQQNSYERQKQAIDQSKAYQSDLEGYGVRPDYDKNRENIAKQADLDLKKKDAEIESYENQWSAANDKLFKAASEGNDEQLRVAQAEMQAAWDAMAQAEVERNELLAQSQRDLTQVYMDEWTKRAERWGQWGEMFGEYLGEQVMLEKQANDARARGDLETAKKIEQQQKQNKQALIQNLLSKIVDEAALWAKEYALKMMFNSLMLAEDKKKAIEEVSLQGKQSMLSIFLNALTGQSEEQKKGLPGLVTGAIIFAATMALQALAKSAIANMFPEAASGSTANRKLSTGMLTYESGYYPDEYYSVNGADGKTYRAKYEGAGMKTGIYGGGAHFGIFSEKQPEMIVDGKTTQKLILNYPYIYDAITTIAKNGRLVNAMPTFASGDYPAGMQRIAQVETVDASGGAASEDMIQMRATMDRTNATIDRLSRLLEGGITAHLDGLENYKQQKKNERFLKRRGID